MADQTDIKVVLYDAIDTGAMHRRTHTGGSTVNLSCGEYAKFLAQFRAALAELPPDAMVCEVLEAMDN